MTAPASRRRRQPGGRPTASGSRRRGSSARYSSSGCAPTAYTRFLRELVAADIVIGRHKGPHPGRLDEAGAEWLLGELEGGA